jgi:hypothetical protein
LLCSRAGKWRTTAIFFAKGTKVGEGAIKRLPTKSQPTKKMALFEEEIN